MAAIDEITDHIRIVETEKKDAIKKGYEQSRKLRQSIQKNNEKVLEGIEKSIEETDPQLTEEGVQRITKKGKIYFRSLRAMNNLVHFLNDHFSKFQIPETNLDLTYADLSQFIRVMSRLLNNVNEEQAKADQIMGLDFMLKKRSFYGPIGKLSDDLTKLRALKDEEYQAIKACEDLEGLRNDVEDILRKIEEKKSEISMLQKEVEILLEEKSQIDQEYSSLIENPVIQASHQRSVRMTELEIQMGRRLNSFKKVFKKFARESQRGSISSDFGIVSSALAYEENPVHQFLQEGEGNPEIIVLFEELISVAPDLRLKQKEINNVRQILKAIETGKLDSDKKEWLKLSGEKQKEATSAEFKEAYSKLEDTETRIKDLEEKLSAKNDEIALKTREADQLSQALQERKERAAIIREEVLEGTI
ncbi:MAG: hypothetical protein ACFFFG_03075 [Candidatus Thorarchaeota archaeon]